MNEQEIDIAVREAIQQERERRGFTTDRDLAKDLGIFPKHISHWRNGRLSKLDRILIALVLRNSISHNQAA